MKKLFQLTGGRLAALATVALLALTGCQTCDKCVKIESTTAQNIPFTAQNGGSGAGCPGAWTGFAQMTNSTDGTVWLSPPAGATNATFTDASGFAAPYVSVAYVKRKDLVKWCDTNSVTFPVNDTKTYQMIVYVKSTLPPPTNGQPLSLQVTWH
jgi:hypothetical protein